jgi:proteasome lid subunit RPN8/RPN11
MIFIARADLKAICDAAETAYPRECCGLLVGRRKGADEVRVTRVCPSANVTATDARDSFEVSPQLRFDVMRELGDGPECIVGHYHSHPDHPAQPSVRDLERAWEPDLVWLIVAVLGGQAIHATAHVLDVEGRQFREVPLRTLDWQPYPERPPPGPTKAESA